MKVEIDLETALYLAECAGQHNYTNVAQAGGDVKKAHARRSEACHALGQAIEEALGWKNAGDPPCSNSVGYCYRCDNLIGCDQPYALVGNAWCCQSCHRVLRDIASKRPKWAAMVPLACELPRRR